MTGEAGREGGRGLEIFCTKKNIPGRRGIAARGQQVAGGGILHSSGHGSAIVFLVSFVLPIPPLLQFQKHNDFDEHALVPMV